ncbi:hypothetical protein JQN72_00505 [Phycicoccus sp. CSK15P-2]|uniref:HAAS signaling domain-containing protein n=1 Tax=Phycicoccus sp. CSK15P-2 TaxID=2807627 RepID=UPI00194F2E20|nr:hypothetical protein [Phycicoccus sp. CSK15P-2]MBM6402725.1 hypothetical protein [Phycicoccus sp. CSK15P-2]
MSTPTQPVVDSGTDDARAYVRAVRAWLDDLPPEDVDDLTLGMEADLAERAAEGGVHLGALVGEPESYAAELRAAAGLPPRTAVEGPSSPPWHAGLVVAARGWGAGLLERAPWLRDLRPVWWLARGWALGWCLASVLWTGRVVLLPTLGAVVSFWLGHRLVGVGRADVRVVTTSLNAVAALVLPASLGFLVYSASPDVYEPWVPPGVSVGGSQVQDLYVYDANGDRVEGARIFDQDGQGLFVDPEMLAWQDGVPTRPDGTVDVRSDVFPVDLGNDDRWANPWGEWAPPLTLPPLPVVPTAEAEPTVGPSSSPEATSSPTPTSDLTPAPSRTPTPGAVLTPAPTRTAGAG